MLSIEVDGEIHQLHLERDSARDLVLKERGIMTIRIPSLDLFDTDSAASAVCVKLVVIECEKRSGRKAWPIRR